MRQEKKNDKYSNIHFYLQIIHSHKEMYTLLIYKNSQRCESGQIWQKSRIENAIWHSLLSG